MRTVPLPILHKISLSCCSGSRYYIYSTQLLWVVPVVRLSYLFAPIYADKSIQFALNFGSFSVLFSCGGVDHGALFDLLNAFRFCWSRSVVVDGLFTIAPIPTPTIRVPRGPFSWVWKKLFSAFTGLACGSVWGRPYPECVQFQAFTVP